MSGTRTSGRNRFDPAKLLLGLVLMTVATGLVLRALGAWDLSYALLILLVPAALILSGLVAAADRMLRGRHRDTRELP